MKVMRGRVGSAAMWFVLVLTSVACTTQPSSTPRLWSVSPSPVASPTGTVGSLLPSGRGLTVADVPRLLRLTWQGYKTDEIQGDGRVIDHGREGVSTSEGQSYALLRAVWMDDKPAFDRIWTWTHDNLQVRADHLFGYLWGKDKGGRWTILDTNSATDADEDITLALLFAAHHWHDNAYGATAAAIVKDIWTHEVALVKGTPYLTAGSWAPANPGPGPALDPSYLAPYAYRLFARIDGVHPWDRLVASSYAALAACSAAPLGTRRSVGLPPNWCVLKKATGRPTAFSGVAAADDYGYDAFRTMWRIALDAVWNREPRATAYLSGAGAAFLRTQWRTHGMLTAYTHAGRILGVEDALFYGGDIGAFVVSDPPAARAILLGALLPLFHQSNGVAYWGQRYNYYEQNWVWFGVALAAGHLPNDDVV